jgi:hypothetical protein
VRPHGGFEQPIRVHDRVRTEALDVRYALRALRHAPLFTAVAALSMAFGIGANTAMFTLVDQVLLRQLPVERPAELGRP